MAKEHLQKMVEEAEKADALVVVYVRINRSTGKPYVKALKHNLSWKKAADYTRSAAKTFFDMSMDSAAVLNDKGDSASIGELS